MVTLADFRTRFPEFASVPDARVNLFLSDALAGINSSVWPLSLFDVAQAYLAAHLLSMASSVGAKSGRIVTSDKVGELQRTYASPDTMSGSTYSLTVYGMEYLRLSRQVRSAPFTTSPYFTMGV